MTFLDGQDIKKNLSFSVLDVIIHVVEINQLR